MSQRNQSISDPNYNQLAEWNLPVIATSPEETEVLSRRLGGAILTCGGWILKRVTAGENCMEIDFEFPRANCVEMYSVLVASGLTLSQQAHMKLTELCHCTRYLLETRSLEIVRLQLTVYTQAGTASDGSAYPEPHTEAA